MFRIHLQALRVDGATVASGLRRSMLLGALAVTLTACALAMVAALPASAFAGSPAALDAPENGTAPLVAFDPSTGTSYVTWQDPISGDPELCILPAGEATCKGGSPILLTDSAYPPGSFSGAGGLVVLPNGDVVVIGTPTSSGSVAWRSEPGGGGFLAHGQGLQNGGEPISPVSLFYTSGNAVALSDTDVGLLDDYGDFFSDSAYSAASPAIPSPNTNQTTPPGEFPRKSLWAAGPEIAAEPAPTPAPEGSDIVVGVGDNFGGPSLAIPGCLNGAATGYGVSVGKVDGTSNAAGTLNAEGLPAYGLLACSAEAPVVASGGQDGIGLVQEEGEGIDGAGSTITVDYRPFLATSSGGSFGAPVELADVTHETLDGVNELDLAEDSGTGVYATWTDGQGLVLDYSANGGGAWGPPVVVPAPANGGQDNPQMVGIGGGTVEIAYQSNPGTGNQVFIQEVNYQALYAAENPPPPPPPPPPPAPVVSLLKIPTQTDDVSSKDDFSVSVQCSGAPCTGTLTLTARFKKTTGKGKKKKTKIETETIGSVSFSSLALGTDTITLKLNGAGSSLLKDDGYKLSSSASATYIAGSKSPTATGTLSLVGHKPKKGKKGKKGKK